MSIGYALFDMDGTVIDSLFFWEEKWKEFGSRYLHVGNYEPPAGLDRTVRTMPIRECAALIKKEFHLAADEDELFSFVLGDLPGFYRTKTNVKPGMEALLADFKARGIRMCLATATENEIAAEVMEHFGLANYFEAVVSCADEDVAVGKESPKVYFKALNILGAKPEETVLFEDSFAALRTAKGIGLYTVGIEDPHNFSVEELPRYSDLVIPAGENIFEAFRKRAGNLPALS